MSAGDFEMRRDQRRAGEHGFTLVELMIVVAIIGVLAALAVYGVNRYLGSAKTAEAKNTVGAIARASVAAYERETMVSALLGDSGSSTIMHVRCNSSVNRVPKATPVGKKYQPSMLDADFNTGDNVTGWKCLRFAVNQPIYFSYGYVTGVGTGLSGATANGFEASAFGDLNGNGGGAITPGTTVSTFARGADIRNGQVVLSTSLFIQNETE